jgi:type II secretory pathway component GspD/PulD (secretin)
VAAERGEKAAMRKAWLTRLLRWIASAALLGAVLTAAAQLAEPTYQFELPAQDVGSALRRFGEVTHQQIIFSEATVKGSRSGVVIGTFTAAQALHLLLAGTGLKVTRTDAGVFYIGNGVTEEN